MDSYSPILMKDTVYKNNMYQTLNTFWLSIVSDNAGARTFLISSLIRNRIKNYFGCESGGQMGSIYEKKTRSRISRATVSLQEKQ